LTYIYDSQIRLQKEIAKVMKKANYKSYYC